MAKQLQSVQLGAAGFKGVNSMDPALELSLDFAETADHGVIDEFGRLGARKGFQLQTSSTDANFAPLTDTIEVISEWSRPGNDPVVVAAGNLHIFYVTTVTDANDTLTSFTLPYVPTGDKWQMLDFNGEMIFIQEGHDPLVLDETGWGTKTLTLLELGSSESVPAVPWAKCATAAYGRLWFGGPDDGITNEPQTVYWSDTLIADGWTEGFSGSLNLANVWPNGYDEVVAIAAHNERLVIFGKNSIVIYTGATDPSNMALEDAVSGTGCAFRDTVAYTGEDIVFLSYTGVKSLQRTVLQNSMPTGDLTANIRDKIVRSLSIEIDNAVAVYSAEESMYVICFKTSGTAYYLDYKSSLEEGRKKCTVWPGAPFKAWHRGDDGTLYTGGLGGVAIYAGYTDNGLGYRFQYYGPYLTFGDASRVKIVKKLITTVVGGVGRDLTVYWGYGYTQAYSTEVYTISGGATGYFNESEYNESSEYTTGVATDDIDTNTTGSGDVVRIGIGVDVNGGAFSLQQLRVHVIMGRIV